MQQLFNATKDLADARHRFSHGGERRPTGDFTSILEMRGASQILGKTFSDVDMGDGEALEQLSLRLADEVGTVGGYLVHAFRLMQDRYQTRLVGLGGLDVPSEEEILKGSQVREFFSGKQKEVYIQRIGDESRDLGDVQFDPGSPCVYSCGADGSRRG